MLRIEDLDQFDGTVTNTWLDLSTGKSHQYNSKAGHVFVAGKDLEKAGSYVLFAIEKSQLDEMKVPDPRLEIARIQQERKTINENLQQAKRVLDLNSAGQLYIDKLKLQAQIDQITQQPVRPALSSLSCQKHVLEFSTGERFAIYGVCFEYFPSDFVELNFVASKQEEDFKFLLTRAKYFTADSLLLSDLDNQKIASIVGRASFQIRTSHKRVKDKPVKIYVGFTYRVVVFGKSGALLLLTLIKGLHPGSEWDIEAANLVQETPVFRRVANQWKNVSRLLNGDLQDFTALWEIMNVCEPVLAVETFIIE